jgi:hypothetical protein
MQHAWGRGEVYTGFGWGNLMEREHLEDLGVDERIILRRILRKCEGTAWTGSSWLRIVTEGWYL